MPKATPDFLQKMLHNIENGKKVTGKNGNLTIEKQDDRFVKVVHFGTTILDLDFWGDTPNDKVAYFYMESVTDSRYIKAVLNHYNLLMHFDIGYGSVNGGRFYYLDGDTKKERFS